MLTKLDTDKKLVGVKQVKRALNGDEVELVYLAKDAEGRIVSSIIEQCKEKNIEIYYVDSMKELGKACKIDVSAATAALLK